MFSAMAQSRAAFAAMTPEQKAQWGLTDAEWDDLLGNEEGKKRPPSR